MVKAIIFDMGGVLIIEPHDSWKDIFHQIAPPAGMDPEALISGFKSNEHDIQTGRVTLLDFYTQFLKNLKLTANPEDLLKRHIELYNQVSGKINADLVKIIQNLRQRFKTACFTNTEVEIASLNKERGLFNNFDRVFISTEMGMRKPDHRSYMYVIKELAIRPEEGVFIDNNKAYVDAAEEVGLNGITYKNNSQLIQELSVYSVRVN